MADVVWVEWVWLVTSARQSKGEFLGRREEELIRSLPTFREREGVLIEEGGRERRMEEKERVGRK